MDRGVLGGRLKVKTERQIQNGILEFYDGFCEYYNFEKRNDDVSENGTLNVWESMVEEIE